MDTELVVALPVPHPKQAEIMRSPAKRKVICAGRRFGKTHMAAQEGVEQMTAGRRVVFASTTQDQVDTFWELAKQWLQPLLDASLIYKNESKRLMVFNHNGGRIKAKTAWNADTMRGDHGDFIVLDEFAQMQVGVWNYVVSPMMLDTDGDTWFISTPLRRNHFHAMYQRALNDDTGRWMAFRATSYDNPYLSPQALEEITIDMSDDAYRQEILAEFLESEGAVFRNIAANVGAPPDVDPQSVMHDRIVCGVDWGKEADYSAFCVFNATTCQELELYRINQADYIIQRNHLLELCAHWGVETVLVEHNSVGIPNFEQLVHDAPDNLRLVPFETTSRSKPQLIESLALALDREQAQWLDDPVATGELESYERKTSRATGRSTYSAPAGMHDDTVIARALAWWLAENIPETYLQRAAVSGLYASRSDGERRRVGHTPRGNGLYRRQDKKDRPGV
jgi:hypothetical protein